MMRLIVGISGASGVIMGYELLKSLKQHGNIEVHLVITEGGTRTLGYETTLSLSDVIACADFYYCDTDMAASISSGSFKTDGMIVIPCSMKTTAGIAMGYASNLLVRAVDVCIKEARRVVLVPREMPLSRIHLRNMSTCAELGCIIVPPVLTFYNGPKTIQDQVNHIIGKVMMQFGLDYKKFVPWKRNSPTIVDL